MNPRGTIYTTSAAPKTIMMMIDDGLLEPNSIMVVYVDPPGMYAYGQFAKSGSLFGISWGAVLSG